MNTYAHILLKSILVWFLIIPFAILNGTLREFVLAPVMGYYALPLSGVSLSIAILAIAWIFIPWLTRNSPENKKRKICIGVGIFWLVLTIVFETGMGLATGASWNTMLAAYTLKDGNLWLLVLIATAFAPWLAAKRRRLF